MLKRIQIHEARAYVAPATTRTCKVELLDKLLIASDDESKTIKPERSPESISIIFIFISLEALRSGLKLKENEK